jgi:hypothetical protein
MTAPRVAKPIRFTGDLASPICDDLAPRMSILSSRALPNFHVSSRPIRMKAVIRVYNATGNVTETHEHKEDLHGAMNGLAILPALNGHSLYGDRNRLQGSL